MRHPSPPPARASRGLFDDSEHAGDGFPWTLTGSRQAVQPQHELCRRYHEYVTGRPLPVMAISPSMEHKVYVLMTRGDPQWHVDALIRLEEEGGE